MNTYGENKHSIAWLVNQANTELEEMQFKKVTSLGLLKYANISSDLFNLLNTYVSYTDLIKDYDKEIEKALKLA